MGIADDEDDEEAVTAVLLVVSLVVVTEAEMVVDDSDATATVVVVVVVAASPCPECDVVFLWRVSKQPLEMSSWQQTARTQGLAPGLGVELGWRVRVASIHASKPQPQSKSTITRLTQ